MKNNSMFSLFLFVTMLQRKFLDFFKKTKCLQRFTGSSQTRAVKTSENCQNPFYLCLRQFFVMSPPKGWKPKKRRRKKLTVRARKTNVRSEKRSKQAIWRFCLQISPISREPKIEQSIEYSADKNYFRLISNFHSPASWSLLASYAKL